jgi:hypothetical protein
MESLRSSLPLNRLLPGNQSPQRFLLVLLRRRDQLPRTLSRIVINRRQLLVLLRQNLRKGQRHNLRPNRLSPRNLRRNLLHRQPDRLSQHNLQRSPLHHQPDRRQLLPLLRQSLPKGQRHNLRRNQHNHQPSLQRLPRRPPQLSGLRNRHNRPRVSNQLNLRPLNPNLLRRRKPSLRLSLPLRSRRNARLPKRSTKLPRQKRRSRQRTNRSRSNSSYGEQTLPEVQAIDLEKSYCSAPPPSSSTRFAEGIAFRTVDTAEGVAATTRHESKLIFENASTFPPGLSKCEAMFGSLRE